MKTMPISSAETVARRTIRTCKELLTAFLSLRRNFPTADAPLGLVRVLMILAAQPHTCSRFPEQSR